MKMSPPLRCALVSMLALFVSNRLTATYNWGPSGLNGAGSQNCLAIQPGGTGVVLSAADISGFQRSTDYGVTWRTCNLGTPIGGPQKVSTVVFSNNPATPNTAYAGTGDEGVGGGFFVSTDAGLNWTLASSTPRFSGNGENTADYPNLPGRWPRSTGNLICVDETGATKYLYAGTFKDGVMRSTDGGATWTLVGLAGKFIRSLVIDPNAKWKIFATDYANKIWYCNTARTTTNTGTGTTGWTQLASAPDTVEEMIFVAAGSASHLYAAGKNGSTGGLWESSDSGTTWTANLLSSTDAAATFTGVAGYYDSVHAKDVLFVAASNPVKQSGDANYRTVLKSADSGATWSVLTLAANIVNETGGAGGPPWWMSTGNANYMLGNVACDLASVQVDPNNTARVLVSGRGGIWGTTNANAASTSVRWYPMVGGLSVNVGYWVATDPSHPGRVYYSNGDFLFFWSADFGQTFLRNRPAGTTYATNSCRGFFVDPTDSKVYIATFDDSDTKIGTVFSNPDPTNLSNTWTDEGLGTYLAVTDIPRGVIALHNGSTTYQLCVVAHNGLWRKSGTSWSDVTPTGWTQPSGAPTITFAAKASSPYVFVYVNSSGLWRSDNWGAANSWSKIWSTTTSGVGSGFVVADPNVEGRLYVSVDSGVFRFDDARTGNPTPTALAGGPANPGPITWSNEMLYVCDIVNSSHNGRLYKWTQPTTTTAAIQEADSFDYPSQCGWPLGVAVDNGGITYVANKDNACMVGASNVLFTDNFEDGNANGWTVDSGTWSVTTSGGGKIYSLTSTTGSNVSHGGTSTWADYSVQADIKPVALGTGTVGLSFRFTDTNNRYFVLLGNGTVTLKKNVGGTQSVIDSKAYTVNAGTTYTVKAMANGTLLQVFVNGVLLISKTDSSFSSGQIALNAFNASVDYDNIVVNAAN